jgi:hypothetical protein
MTVANLAYLFMIVSAYWVFILVLGVYWLGGVFGPRRRASRIEVTPARAPLPPSAMPQDAA